MPVSENLQSKSKWYIAPTKDEFEVACTMFIYALVSIVVQSSKCLTESSPGFVFSGPIFR
jgi:hypothetical protein